MSEQAIVPGTINLYRRPKVLNLDGTISTVRSMSFQDARNGYEVLVPTVSDDGRILSDDEAVEQYYRSGQHLGMFRTPEEATAFAEQLHNDFAAGKYDATGKRVTTINGVPIQPMPSHPVKR